MIRVKKRQHDLGTFKMIPGFCTTPDGFMWPISVQSKCMTTFEVLHWESSSKACKSVQLEGLSWYDPKSIRNIIPSFCQDNTDNHFGRCVSCSVQDFVEIELRACVSFLRKFGSKQFCRANECPALVSFGFPTGPTM
jgi:hypothetical protein